MATFNASKSFINLVVGEQYDSTDAILVGLSATETTINIPVIVGQSISTQIFTLTSSTVKVTPAGGSEATLAPTEYTATLTGSGTSYNIEIVIDNDSIGDLNTDFNATVDTVITGA